MPAEEPNEEANASRSDDDSSQTRARRSRPRTLTPEQRRFLGKPRPLHERAEPQKRSEEELPHVEPAPAPPPAPRIVPELTRPKVEAAKRSEAREIDDAEEPEQRAPVLRRDEKSSRRIEMQHAALMIGGILLLCFTFYVGKKFDYWRYLLMAKVKQPQVTDQVLGKFADVSPNELIEQAFRDERSNDWRSAIERFIAAKRKNLAYPGILFHAGKIAYEKGDFDNADKLFERAIAFHENIDTANFFRGLIATRHRDLPAAERLFEAATTADPFTADYYYYWAEALRLDYHPHEAIPRYEQAERRARGNQDQTVCRVKIRLARLEAGENTKLKAEIKKEGEKGPLALDWLLPDSAVAIREGRIEEAARILGEAKTLSLRVTDGHGIFVSCTGDRVFQDACRKHQELADICQPSAASEIFTRPTR
jgi:tetratricopeptide (TPR) repeat protein